MTVQERQRKLAPAEEDLYHAANVLSEIVRFVDALGKMVPSPSKLAAEAAGNAQRLVRVATWLRMVVQSWHWGEPLAPREVPTPREVLELAIVAYCPTHREALEDLARVLAAHPPIEHLRYAVCMLDAGDLASLRGSERDLQRQNVAAWLAALVDTAERVRRS